VSKPIRPKKSDPEKENLSIDSFEKARSKEERVRFSDRLTEDSTYSAMQHNKQYDSIMESYAENVQKSLKVNRRYKRWYFYGSLITMAILVGLIIYISVISQNGIDVEAYITALTAFVTAFIVLPVTITKYLFNPEEGKYLKNIVETVQKHDFVMTHTNRDVNSKADETV